MPADRLAGWAASEGWLEGRGMEGVGKGGRGVRDGEGKGKSEKWARVTNRERAWGKKEEGSSPVREEPAPRREKERGNESALAESPRVLFLLAGLGGLPSVWRGAFGCTSGGSDVLLCLVCLFIFMQNDADTVGFSPAGGAISG